MPQHQAHTVKTAESTRFVHHGKRRIVNIQVAMNRRRELRQLLRPLLMLQQLPETMIAKKLPRQLRHVCQKPRVSAFGDRSSMGTLKHLDHGRHLPIHLDRNGQPQIVCRVRGVIIRGTGAAVAEITISDPRSSLGAIAGERTAPRASPRAPS